MHKDLSKLMEKKAASSKPMDEGYKGAKMSMLQALKDEMSGMMGNDLKGLKGLKKVTVAAPDSAGLEAGLDKAQDMLGAEGEKAEEPEGDMSHYESYSPEELEAIIQQLEAIKASKLK